MIVYLDGAYLERSEARISIADRGFLYGDALYENFRVHRRGFFRFDEHYARLASGAEALRIPPPAAETLRRIAGELAARNGLDDGSMRVTLTRGPGGEGLSTRRAGPPTVLATLSPIPAERARRAEAGWSAIVAKARRIPAALPGTIKSANRLDAILAKLEAESAGVDEAILLTVDGWVAEGTTCNVFWRTGETLFTPSLDLGILPGVTRGVVFEIAKDEGWSVREGRFAPSDLRGAQEILLTMTSLGPVPVRSLDGAPVPGPWTTTLRLREAYTLRLERESAADPLPGREGVERRAAGT